MTPTEQLIVALLAGVLSAFGASYFSPEFHKATADLTEIARQVDIRNATAVSLLQSK